ncbi:MAG: gamma-glutamyltransferase [Chloroflexota bacterium]
MAFTAIENRFQPDAQQKCAVGERGMVASAYPEATAVGVALLEAGGNAVDAACGVALALGVCEPQASGIGGQSVAIVHLNGRSFGVDGSSRAPSLAHLSRYRDGETHTGHRAVAVPSTVATLGYLNEHYGRLPWPQIVQPAIELAQTGYRLRALQRDLLASTRDELLAMPDGSAAHYFLQNGRDLYGEDEMFRQPELAQTLQTLADEGPRAFYRGRIARLIDDDMRANDGFLRADDLALIPWPVEREVMWRRYKETAVCALPPPTTGRTLLLTLTLLDQLPPGAFDESPASYRRLAELLHKSLLATHQHPIAPHHYHENRDPILTADFARQQLANLHQRVPFDHAPEGNGETTHLSVMDGEGNAVGITQSVDAVYGAKVAARGLGFVYNNYIMALDTADPGNPFYLRPNATPFTNKTPAMLFRDGKLWLLLGSPGSDRIFAALSQLLTNVFDKGMSLGQAIDWPRLHAARDGVVHLEGRLDPAIEAHLAQHGYQTMRHANHDFYFGGIHAIMRCHDKNEFHGVADTRRDGTAVGF